MIDVRGTRAESGEATPASRYGFGSNPVLSRMPLYVVLALVGIVTYLRSAFPDVRWPVRAAEPEPGLVPEEDAVLIAQIDEIGVEGSSEITEAAAEDIRREDEQLTRHKGNNVVPFPIPAYRLIDSPPIQFPAFELNRIDIPASLPIDWNFAAGPAGRGSGGSSDPVTAEPERRNRAPESGSTPRLNEAVAGAALLIGFDQLLAGMSDADGDALSVGAARVSEGSIARTSEGFVYSSNAAALPKDIVVLYEVTDGVATIIRTAIIPLVRGPVLGTPGDDSVLGTDSDDRIDGLAGDDLIDARDGNDIIRGGDGDDHIVAGAGNDFVFAGNGNDIVFGGAGDDVISGGAGDDRLFGDAGDDVVSGDAGNDELHGGDGDDLLDGGDGNDRLHDGAGADRVLGGSGDDIVVATLDAADDIFDGGDGDDTLDYSAATQGLDIDLGAGIVTGDEVGYDRVSDFESAVGGSGDDVFTIGGSAMRLTGGDGADRFVFHLPDGIDKPTLIHDILDFVAGDRITVSRFEFSLDEDDDREDRFERYYLDRDDDDEDGSLELRIRHRDGDDGPTTVFEFDGDGDYEFEMTIEVNGYHHPFIYETVTA